MGNFARLLKGGCLGLLLLSAGCTEQDADRIGKVGNKALDRASAMTGNAGEKIGLSIRNAKAAIDGMDLTGRVHARIKWDQPMEGAAIKVQAEKNHVTLNGSVRDDAQRRRAVELAKTTLGVDDVTDALQLSSAQSTNGAAQAN